MFFRILMKIEFSRQSFEEKYQISNFVNPVQWESNCSMRTDRRTDMTELIVAVRNFSKTPKKVTSLKEV